MAFYGCPYKTFIYEFKRVLLHFEHYFKVFVIRPVEKLGIAFHTRPSTSNVTLCILTTLTNIQCVYYACVR